MPCRLILVPLSGYHDSSYPKSLELSALDSAFRMAQAWGARVRVFLIDAQSTDTYKPFAPWMPARGIEQVFAVLDSARKRRRKYALQAFQSMVDRFNAPLVSEGADAGFAVELLEGSGSVHELLAAQGKLADLIVVAHAPFDGPAVSPIKLEIALRETGRPVLVAPVKSFTTVAEHVAIAWNGSNESARAVALSLDLLRQSAKVTIVSIQEGDSIEPSGEQLADYLGLHDIEASPIALEGSEYNAGAHLLTECDRVGADLLLMGAYTRSRTRQVIFGGATSHILRKATIPVIMVE